jgi:UDP-N-acetylglucosamine acyltransferase
MATKIHPTAVIDPKAQLGENVEIGPYVVIGEDVQIGSGTKVGPHCIIEFSTLGKDNLLTGAAYVGMPPQDWSYKGEHTRFTMGDSNVIREGVSLHRGSHATNLTSMGSNCMLMANSHIGHDCRVGDNVIMVNSSAAAGHVQIGDRATISGLVGIHQFTRIGKFAMISGGGMANQDIIPYVIAQGDRARPVNLNLVGLRRNGFTRESIKLIKHTFKTLFFGGLTMKDAIAKLRAENLPPEAALILDFCEASKRGVARPRRTIRELETADND